jgi:hypothetical protein
MAHYLHDDDEAKQDAQLKRIKRRANPSNGDGLSFRGLTRLPPSIILPGRLF